MNNDKTAGPATLPKENTPITSDGLRTNLAIGSLTLSLSALLLYIICFTIFSVYHPDIQAALDAIVPLTICPVSWFAPEPVERLQFQVALLCMPFIVFGIYTLINHKRALFVSNPRLCLGINISALATLLIYCLILSGQKLSNIPDQTTTWFFHNNIIGLFNPFIIIIVYGLLTYLLLRYYRQLQPMLQGKILNIACVLIAAFIIVDVVMYNVLHPALTSLGQTGEINAVFYSITQVYAGKSMLVDTNCQYGLFAWFLAPVFKVIGMSAGKMGMVMALLDGASFLLIYLGIRKLVSNNLLSLFVFTCLIFWCYWSVRVPADVEPEQYYQYWPVRLLFPAISFFLAVTWQYANARFQKILLPVVTLSASFAVLWNLDSGIVVYGATVVFLLAAAVDQPTTSLAIKKALFHLAYIIGSLCLVLLFFFVSTKLHSGQWPQFGKIATFQGLFYMSGYFMLPMVALHFWNFPALAYMAACLYCIANLRKGAPRDMPILVFLCILGCGLFAYFQGRSYDLSLNAVMYPAIIIIGFFCSRLIAAVKSGEHRFHEGLALFAFLFIFLLDGSFSMAYNAPAITTAAIQNATSTDNGKEEELAQQMNFISSNFHRGDTVLIIAKNFESFYYANGAYVNPINIPGSSEMAFKSELEDLLDFIRTTKYPIVYDAALNWYCTDTIVKALAQGTTVVKELPGRHLLLLAPRPQQQKNTLTVDSHTIYFNAYGSFSRFLAPASNIHLGDTFTVELVTRLDTSLLVSRNVAFCSWPQNGHFAGVLMCQDGDDLTNYTFKYGNGAGWCTPVSCHISCTHNNDIVIHVRKNLLSIYNNGVLCGEANTNSVMNKESTMIYLNSAYAGTISELKISDN